MKKRRFAALSDFAVIGLILVSGICAYFAFVSGSNGAYAEILWENKVIERVDLSENKEFSVNGFENVIFKVEDGAIAFMSSDCPDKICVNTGFIRHKGQSAVCLPNRLAVRIAEANNEADTYAG